MSRTRGQAGFTVVEMLVAMMVFGIVIAGALTMMQVVMRQQRGVLDRTEAAQRGRLVLDQMTRQIRSQVCKDETTKGLIDASPTMLTFYADLQAGEDGPKPVKRRLEYQATARRIVETVYSPDGTAVASTRVMLQDVWPSAKTPYFFTYKAYPLNFATLPDPSPSEELSGTLTPTSVGRVALIEINFDVRPTGARADTTISTPLSDSVVLRNADPNATKGDPTCI